MAGLLTVGHGALDRTALMEVLRIGAVSAIVDVRRFPGSRSNSDVRREALEIWLPTGGVSYRWEERLGGRRHVATDTPVLDTWWTNRAFQAYSVHTRTPTFRDALRVVLSAASKERVAVMCSESVWWRCHRRLIADVAVLVSGMEVQHLFPTGRVLAHRPAAGARLRNDGSVVWDG